ncbi:MAG: hypothetical protein ACQEQ0_12875 [Bacteroidota bacterium]
MKQMISISFENQKPGPILPEEVCKHLVPHFVHPSIPSIHLIISGADRIFFGLKRGER